MNLTYDEPEDFTEFEVDMISQEEFDNIHLERVCAEFCQLVEQYGAGRILRELPEEILYEIMTNASTCL